MTPEQRQEIRERHQTYTVGRVGFCDSDEQPWPCDTARLLADYDHLREQNHEHAARRDREAAALQSEVDRWRNRAQRAKERVRGTPVDWSTDARSQEPDGWWNYTSEVNRDIFIAMLADYDHLVEVARALLTVLDDTYPEGEDDEQFIQAAAAIRALIDPATPEQPAWKCDWQPDDLNPIEDGCPYCADRMCARFDGLNCTHDRIERHGYPATPEPVEGEPKKPDDGAWERAG